MDFIESRALFGIHADTVLILMCEIIQTIILAIILLSRK